MAAAAARSVLRPSSLRSALVRVASGGARSAARPQLVRNLGPRHAAVRFLRSPVETSFCVESLMPMHSATAAALMTSLLTVSRQGYGWLSDGQDETR